MRRPFFAILLLLLVVALLLTCAKLSPTGEEAEKDSPCTLCHGNPPNSGAHAFHTSVYSYDCALCHPLSGSAHENGSADVRLLRPGDTAVSGSYSAGRCGNLYCHGDFEGGNHSAPVWTDTAVACGTCHNLPPKEGAHLSHAQYGCDLCHSGYSRAGNTHANGTEEVNGPIRGGTYSPAEKRCSAVDCHGYGMTGDMEIIWNNGTVRWFDTLSCLGCHDYTNHMVAERDYYQNLYPGTSPCFYCHRDSGFHADTARLQD